MSNRELFFLIFIWGWSLSAWADETWTVRASEWAQPRSGEMIASLPGVRAVMRMVIGSPASRVAINHPGGDQGIWWAEELKGWLITLGMNSDRIELVPGSGRADMMHLSLIESQRNKSEK